MPEREPAPGPALPPPPERPDCCFGGCAQCVLDDYAEAMSRWEQEVEAIEAAHRARQQPPSAAPRED